MDIAQGILYVIDSGMDFMNIDQLKQAVVGDPASLPAHLVAQAQRRPAGVALRFKRLGIWHERSWSALAVDVGGAAAALEADGFQAGDVLSLLGQPTPEALVLMLAAQWLGGVVAPLDMALSPDGLAAALGELEPRVVLGEDQEQVDRLLAAGFSGTRLLYADGRGLHRYTEAVLMAFADWLAPAAGRDVPVLRARPTGSALRYHTHGTWDGGAPGDSSHAEVLAAAARLVRVAQLNTHDEAFAGRRFAPASVVRYLVAAWLLGGFCFNIAESPESRDRDRREIAPTLVLGSAQTYVRLRERIVARLPRPSEGWRGRLARRALSGGGAGWLARLLILRPLRDAVGLGRVRTAIIVGGAPQEDLRAFYRALGVTLQPWPAADVPAAVEAPDDLGRLLAVWVAP